MRRSLSRRQAYLPDFCAATTVFVVVIVAALVAIVLSLAAYDGPGDFLYELSKTSAMFVKLWLALLCRRARSCVCCVTGSKAAAGGVPSS